VPGSCLVLRSRPFRFHHLIAARLFPLALLLFMVFQADPLRAQDAGATTAPAPATTNSAGYRLGARDQIRVSVFNQADLTGDYVLDGDGRISMPLIGVVQAGGLTPTELAEHISSLLKPDYLINPRVSVEVSNYRPYFLVGEVQSTGSFPYVEGITYLTAIAMAGGYSYRAKKDIVYVTRAGEEGTEELKLDVNEKVKPGDIIRVAERFF